MEKLFTLDRTNGNGGETTPADIKTAYGLLLRATKLPGALHHKAIAEQVSWARPYTTLLSTYICYVLNSNAQGIGIGNAAWN